MGEQIHSAVLGAGQIVALNARGAAPEWVMLTPKGPRIVGNDGRVFTLDNPGAVVDAFAKSGLKLPIDINHAQFHKASKGEASPAVGWIEQLDARDGAIWGRVEWNSRGESALKDRDYRYISPALTLDAAGRVVGIAHAGLVNEPNFTMPALNARGDATEQPTLLREIMERCGHGRAGAALNGAHMGAEPSDAAPGVTLREVMERCGYKGA